MAATAGLLGRLGGVHSGTCVYDHVENSLRLGFVHEQLAAKASLVTNRQALVGAAT